MTTFGNLAATYERWAAQDETFAAEILSRLPSYPDDAQLTQAQRALELINEAETFRKEAANLRCAHPRLIASRLHRNAQ